ncbi:MAG: BRCT domain-containing protein, partial [Lachnospiraceae bacterium]
AGKTFVITGKVFRFSGRSELKGYIEERGGKVTGSVTAKTDYLINNDAASQSSKNKTAKELNVPVITEDEFLEMVGQKGE